MMFSARCAPADKEDSVFHNASVLPTALSARKDAIVKKMNAAQRNVIVSTISNNVIHFFVPIASVKTKRKIVRIVKS